MGTVKPCGKPQDCPIKSEYTHSLVLQMSDGEEGISASL